MSWSEAEFTSVCPVCEKPIEVGDPIVHGLDGWQHPTHPEDEATAPDICSGCHIQMPRSGVCRECNEVAA